MEQVSDDGGDRAFRVHQLFHLETDCIGEGEALLIGIEKAAMRAFQRERVERRFERVVLQHQAEACQRAFVFRR